MPPPSEQSPPAVLLATMVAPRFTVAPLKLPIPPPQHPALLPDRVLSVTVSTAPKLFSIAPPK